MRLPCLRAPFFPPDPPFGDVTPEKNLVEEANGLPVMRRTETGEAFHTGKQSPCLLPALTYEREGFQVGEEPGQAWPGFAFAKQRAVM